MDIKTDFETWAIRKMYHLKFSSWIQLDDKRGYYADNMTNNVFIGYMAGKGIDVLP
jgi:hypothetical protein